MKIGQISPIRSGSTLVYNLLREIFPNDEVCKDHNFECVKNFTHVVATIRHPFDSIISGIKSFENKIDNESIKKFTDIYLSNGGNGMCKVKNILIIKYEDFYKNYDYLYDEFEKYFTIKISVEKRIELTNKYNINNVNKMANEYPSFYQFNNITHIHGKHISNTFGESVHNILSDEQKKIILSNTEIVNIMKKFNYAY